MLIVGMPLPRGNPLLVGRASVLAVWSEPGASELLPRTHRMAARRPAPSRMAAMASQADRRPNPAGRSTCG
jgi:hypothetical protein